MHTQAALNGLRGIIKKRNGESTWNFEGKETEGARWIEEKGMEKVFDLNTLYTCMNIKQNVY